MLAKLADAPSSQSNASLIGLLVGVAKRLRSGDGQAMIEHSKVRPPTPCELTLQSSIVTFYTTQIVSEKTGAPLHSVVRAKRD